MANASASGGRAGRLLTAFPHARSSTSGRALGLEPCDLHLDEPVRARDLRGRQHRRVPQPAGVVHDREALIDPRGRARRAASAPRRPPRPAVRSTRSLSTRYISMHQLVLGPEVAIEGPGRVARLAEHVVHRRLAGAVLLDEPVGRPHDLLPLGPVLGPAGGRDLARRDPRRRGGVHAHPDHDTRTAFSISGYGTSAFKSGSMMTLSCAVGSFRAPTNTAAVVSLRFTTTCATCGGTKM